MRGLEGVGRKLVEDIAAMHARRGVSFMVRVDRFDMRL